MSRKNLIIMLILCLSVTMLLVNCGPKKEKAGAKEAKGNEYHVQDYEVANEFLAEWPSAAAWAEWGMPNIQQPASVTFISIVPMGNSIMMGMEVTDAKAAYNALLSQIRKIADISQLSEEKDEHSEALIFMVPNVGIVTVGYAIDEDDGAQTAVISINRM